MPPRGGQSFPNPPPKTASAVAARAAFFCDLCQKGYARANEFAAHESSYDHTHKQRIKDLKAMDKNMSDSANKARRNEEKAAGIIKINPIALGSVKKEGGTGGFKKGGFRSAFAKPVEDSKPAPEVVAEKVKTDEPGGVASDKAEDLESEDEGYEYYDPRKPTGCPIDCGGRR